MKNKKKYTIKKRNNSYKVYKKEKVIGSFADYKDCFTAIKLDSKGIKIKYVL